MPTAAGWAVFELPPGFTLHEAGVDCVLGVQPNELDVETIRRYRLISGA